MKYNRLFFSLAILFCLGFLGSNCHQTKLKEQKSIHSEKLDPKLHPLIFHENTAEPHTVKPIGQTKNGDPLYSVIIYTSNADSLRSLAIQVNSELSKFVTAKISKAQMKQCLNLDFVTYIKASSDHRPDGR